MYLKSFYSLNAKLQRKLMNVRNFYFSLLYFRRFYSIICYEIPLFLIVLELKRTEHKYKLQMMTFVFLHSNYQIPPAIDNNVKHPQSNRIREMIARKLLFIFWWSVECKILNSFQIINTKRYQIWWLCSDLWLKLLVINSFLSNLHHIISIKNELKYYKIFSNFESDKLYFF